MAKTVVNLNGSQLGSHGSSAGTVVYTPAKNPDGTDQKDTRK